MPETLTFPFAVVLALPAAMPATCVPCPDWAGSKGRRAYFHVVPAGAKARATITFAVVYAACPLGYPAGIAYPAGEKYGWRWSTPSSMIAIFKPSPRLGRPVCQVAAARAICDVVVEATAYDAPASTALTPGSALRRGMASAGTTTAAPFRTRR